MPTRQRFAASITLNATLVDVVTITLSGRLTGLVVSCSSTYGAIETIDVVDNVGASLGHIMDNPTATRIVTALGALGQGFQLIENFDAGDLPKLIDGKKPDTVAITLINNDPINPVLFGILWGED